MATYCKVCNAKIGFLDSGYEIVDSEPSYVLCEECELRREALKRTTGEVYQGHYNHFKKMLSDPTTPVAVKDYFADLDNEEKKRSFVMAQKEAAEEAYKQNLEEMLLTTGTNFEGYTIVKYIDVICEEVVFKNSFMNRLSAGFDDLFDAFSFKETEMSGSGELISRARAYVKEKFRRKVASMGANAALGVEFESSIGADVVRVAVFGTAVVIEKNS